MAASETRFGAVNESLHPRRLMGCPTNRRLPACWCRPLNGGLVLEEPDRDSTWKDWGIGVRLPLKSCERNSSRSLCNSNMHVLSCAISSATSWEGAPGLPSWSRSASKSAIDTLHLVRAPPLLPTCPVLPPTQPGPSSRLPRNSLLRSVGEDVRVSDALFHWTHLGLLAVVCTDASFNAALAGSDSPTARMARYGPCIGDHFVWKQTTFRRAGSRQTLQRTTSTTTGCFGCPTLGPFFRFGLQPLRGWRTCSALSMFPFRVLNGLITASWHPTLNAIHRKGLTDTQQQPIFTARNNQHGVLNRNGSDTSWGVAELLFSIGALVCAVHVERVQPRTGPAGLIAFTLSSPGTLPSARRSQQR